MTASRYTTATEQVMVTVVIYTENSYDKQYRVDCTTDHWLHSFSTGQTRLDRSGYKTDRSGQVGLVKWKRTGKSLITIGQLFVNTNIFGCICIVPLVLTVAYYTSAVGDFWHITLFTY